MILITILASLLAVAVPNRVIEITTANVQLVLKTVDHLHLLLHNPTCQHSKDYAQKFLEVQTPLNLGIADCEREKILCSHLNVTHYPTLVGLTNSSMAILDQQYFLEKQGLASQKDPKVILNKIVKRLKSEEGYATVVLEEEGLPVLERVGKSSERGVFYVQPPSRLYSHLQAMVGKKRGCWIISYTNNHLDKYYCGSGYKRADVEKYLQNYNNQRLVPHLFTRQTNQTYMQQTELTQIIRENYSLKKCKLVYFFSKECEHCNIRDVATIDSLLERFKLKSKLALQMYDLDHEELPPNFTLRRIPQLVEFCNFEMSQYGQVFTVEQLSKFLTRTRTVGKIPQAVREEKVVESEARESRAEQQLQL